MIGMRSERGAVALEFALIVPILIVLLLGIIELGFVFNTQITITDAAREGARTMAIQNDQAEARTAAKSAAPAVGPAITDAQIAITTLPTSIPATCSPGTTARVTITYPYTLLTGMFDDTIGHLLKIQGTAAMKCGG